MMIWMCFKLKWARAQWTIVLLAALLPRLPRIQAVSVLERTLSLPVFRMIQATIWVAATMGVFHATAGAQQFDTQPGKSPYTAVVGADFEIAFTVTGAPVEPARWTIKGIVAPGLVLVSNLGNTLMGDQIEGSVIYVQGQPTTPGIYVFSAQAFNADGVTDDKKYEVQINVTAALPSFVWDPRSIRVPTGGRA